MFHAVTKSWFNGLNLIERNLKGKLSTAVQSSPLVLITGAPRVGKKTLGQQFTLSTFDFQSESVLVAARHDPVGFITALPYCSLLANLEYAPFLVPLLEQAVHQQPLTGRFVVTTSQPHLLLSLLQMGVPSFQLQPLAAAEIMVENAKIESLFDDNFYEGARCSGASTSSINLTRQLLKGGFPEAQTDNLRVQNRFFEGYLEACFTTLRQSTQLASQCSPRALFKHLALQSGSSLNQRVLAKALKLNPMSLGRYLKQLKTLFLTLTIPAYLRTQKRTLQTVRTYLLDTGLMSYLLNLNAQNLASQPQHYPQLLKNFVVLELYKQCSWMNHPIQLQYLATYNGGEIDLLLEDEQGRVVALQVRATTQVTARDFSFLKRFRTELGSKFCRGMVLYLGENVQVYDPTLWAVPVSALYK
jgi:uncharacterized protein